MFIWIPAGMSIFGGGEQVLSTVCNHLTQIGHEISILSMISRKNEPKRKDWVPPFTDYNNHVDVGYLDGRHLLKYRQSIKYIEKSYKKHLPEIIIISGNPFMIPPTRRLLQQTESSIKIVYWDHGFLPLFFAPFRNTTLWETLWKLSVRIPLLNAMKAADAFFCMSSGISRIAKRTNPGHMIFTTPNPIKNCIEKIITRPQKPIFIFVGRLDNKQKNISFMLKALSKIGPPNWELIIIGEGNDRKVLMALSKNLGISDKIKWHGFKTNPFNDLQEVSALLLTSRFEGFGMVLVEANQRGIPVISSDCLSGPEDIVIPGINGHLYKEGDMNSFIDLLEKSCNNELPLASPEEISKTALRFNEEYTIKPFISALNFIKDKS
jgi:UDP-D-galactose:(glucosyl)LPS alpha-1,6-D-galactosyltransferase